MYKERKMLLSLAATIDLCHVGNEIYIITSCLINMRQRRVKMANLLLATLISCRCLYSMWNDSLYSLICNFNKYYYNSM
jgi:hypothetical protein